MSGHTPGPWRYVGFQGTVGAHVVVGHPTRDDIVCTVSGPPQSKVAEANAALIGAAPDLLAVVKEYREECRKQGIMFGSINGDADAAIAKAEGR